MAKNQADTGQYRDNPEDGDAVSMHTTRDDYEYDDAPDLPSYSDSEAAVTASRQADDTDQQVLGFDPYPRVQPLSDAVHIFGSKVKNVNETTIRMVGSLQSVYHHIILELSVTLQHRIHDCPIQMS